MKYNPEMIASAKKLRLEGLSYDKIAKELGISSMTIKRWNKREYLKSDDNKDNKNNEEDSNNHDNPDIKSNNNNNKEGNDSNKDVIGNASFSGVDVSYNDKEGSINIEDAKGVTEKSTENAAPNEGRRDKRVTSESHNIAGGGQQYQTSHVSEKPDIDAPDNVLDNFFSRGMIETLIPIGLLVSGFLLKDNKGEKGEFREQRGGGDW